MDENNEAELPTPPPAKPVAPVEEPKMSEIAAIGNVFIEPGKVFEDMRRKPRFIIAGILVLLFISAFQVAFVEKFGMDKIVRARIESSKRTADLDKDQKEKIIEQQSGPIVKYVTFGATPIVILIVFLLGGLIYWLGSNAMGGTAKFLGGVSVWVYSSLPPALVFTIGNIIVLFLKSPDDIDLVTSQGGLLKANLGFFVDAKTMPVIAALLGSFDLFAIWGWVLAAIGLQKIAKISSGAAWAVVLMLGLVGVAAKVIGAMFF